MVYKGLTLCILTDIPLIIATISLGLPIVKFKESQEEVSKLWCISSLKVILNLANSAYPDKIQHHAALHMVFTVAKL